MLGPLQQREQHHRHPDHQEHHGGGHQPHHLRGEHQHHAAANQENPEQPDRTQRRLRPLPQRLERIGQHRRQNQPRQRQFGRHKGRETRYEYERQSKTDNALHEPATEADCKCSIEFERSEKGENTVHTAT